MRRARTTPPGGGAQNAVVVCASGSQGPKPGAKPGSGASPLAAPNLNVADTARLANFTARLSPASELRCAGSALPSTTGPNSGGLPLTDRQVNRALAERKLMARVFARCHAAILVACPAYWAPPEFLGALTAIESGGNIDAVRFEPAVYQHLLAVITGEAPAYGSIRAQDLAQNLGNVLHPKADEFHAQFLGQAFGSVHRLELTCLEDEALRELATSWGYTQIMGYHMVGRRGTVRDLLDPCQHFRIALELLKQFCTRYDLDPRRDFEEMFRCWNAGRPDGQTHSPHYAEDGLGRMKIYRELADGKG